MIEVVGPLIDFLFSFCRCEDQVGEQLLGQEADCPKEESSPQ